MGTRLLRFVIVTSPPAAPLHPARPARAPIRAAAIDGPGRDCPGPLTTRGAGTAGPPERSPFVVPSAPLVVPGRPFNDLSLLAAPDERKRSRRHPLPQQEEIDGSRKHRW